MPSVFANPLEGATSVVTNLYRPALFRQKDKLHQRCFDCELVFIHSCQNVGKGILLGMFRLRSYGNRSVAVKPQVGGVSALLRAVLRDRGTLEEVEPAKLSGMPLTNPQSTAQDNQGCPLHTFDSAFKAKKVACDPLVGEAKRQAAMPQG